MQQEPALGGPNTELETGRHHCRWAGNLVGFKALQTMKHKAAPDPDSPVLVSAVGLLLGLGVGGVAGKVVSVRGGLPPVSRTEAQSRVAQDIPRLAPGSWYGTQLSQSSVYCLVPSLCTTKAEC